MSEQAERVLKHIPWRTVIGISTALVVLGILFSSVSTVITVYNTMVTSRVSVERALADLDGEYQRRHALVDNLVTLVKETKGFETVLMEFEKAIYIETAEAKASATKLSLAAPTQTNKKLGKEDRLSATLSQFVEKFLVLAQHYPTIPDPVLKERTETFAALRRLGESLQALEQEILTGRKGLNESVRVYNQNLAIFPANVFAAKWGFTPLAGFQVLTDDARQDARIAF